MYYKTNWLRSFLVSVVLHGLLLVSLNAAAGLLETKEDVATEMGIPLEMNVPGTEGEEPGSPDGDINGSVDGEVPAGTEGAVLTSTHLAGQEDNKPEPEPEPEAKNEPEPEQNQPADNGAPVLSKEEEEALENYKKKLAEAQKAAGKKRVGPVIVKKGNGGGQSMGQPPRLIEDCYPAVGLTKYHGRVTVFATIGKNGNVIKTKIAVGTRNRFINEIAMAACRRWRFKPALDSKGKPMECIRIISIPFNVPNIERQLEEEKVLE